MATSFKPSDLEDSHVLEAIAELQADGQKTTALSISGVLLYRYRDNYDLPDGFEPGGREADVVDRWNKQLFEATKAHLQKMESKGLVACFKTGPKAWPQWRATKDAGLASTPVQRPKATEVAAEASAKAAKDAAEGPGAEAKELARLREDLEIAQGELSVLAGEHDKLKSTLAETDDRMYRYRKERNDAREDIDLRRAAMKELRAECAKAQEQAGKAAEAAAAARAAEAAAKASRDTHKATADSEIAALTAKLSSVLAKLRDAEGRASVAEAGRATMQKLLDQRGVAKDMEQQALLKVAEERKVALASALAELESSKANSAQLMSALGKVEGQLTEVKAAASKAESERLAAVSALKAAEASSKAAHDTAAAARAAAETCKAEAEAANTRAAEAVRKCDAAQAAEKAALAKAAEAEAKAHEAEEGAEENARQEVLHATRGLRSTLSKRESELQGYRKRFGAL